MAVSTDTGPAGQALAFTIERVLDAPRALVYRVWSEPEHVARWCAPKGFDIPGGVMDFRVGGSWTSHMRAPDGTDHRLRGTYREIVPGERIVFTHAWVDAEGRAGLETVVTVTFEDAGAGTRLTLTQTTFETATARDAHEDGWAETMDSLGLYLTALGPADGGLHRMAPVAREITLTRSFKAPRERVFRAFTEAEMVARWMGADDWPVVACEIEARPGGRMRTVWRHADGREMGLTGTVREIDPPARLVHTELFDEDWTGGETEVTTEFFETDGRTIVVMTIRYRSADARDAVLASPMQDGLAACYRNLDRVLAAA